MHERDESTNRRINVVLFGNHFLVENEKGFSDAAVMTAYRLWLDRAAPADASLTTALRDIKDKITESVATADAAGKALDKVG